MAYNPRIYPNPTTGQLRIEIAGQSRNDSKLEIFDMTGRKVGAYQINPKNAESVIDISHLHPGIYFLKAGEAVVIVVKQ